jgi:hypothetical protein
MALKYSARLATEVLDQVWNAFFADSTLRLTSFSEASGNIAHG